MPKVNLAEKFSKITEYWKPYVAAELNGQHVKLDKIKGEFVFHHHDNEDELFLVVKGRFRMEYRDRHEWIEEGEFVVVPRGVEHKPVADEECWFLLFEPATYAKYRKCGQRSHTSRTGGGVGSAAGSASLWLNLLDGDYALHRLLVPRLPYGQTLPGHPQYSLQRN